jgi:hypothetical protein
MTVDEVKRRRFLRFLLGSPLMAGLGGALEALAQDDDAITAPGQALNVMDFESAARKHLPPAHFAYLATGVDDDATLRANREGFARFSLRVRRLVNVRDVDMSVSLFGTSSESPIVLAPVSSQRAFHPDAEIACAKAARAGNHLQILSTLSSTRLEEVSAARGASLWYQLYPTDQWSVTQSLVKRAAAAGCPALVLTVDNLVNNRETLKRSLRRDPRNCATRRRRHRRLEPRRPNGREWSGHHREPAGGCGRRPRQDTRAGRRRLPPWHRHLQGARPRRHRRLHRPSVRVGPRCLRPTRGGSGARHPPARAAHDHAPSRYRTTRRDQRRTGGRRKVEMTRSAGLLC